MSTRDS